MLPLIPGKKRGDGAMMNLKKILVAKDFSSCSERALTYALDLSARTNAELHLFYAQVLYGDPFGPPAYPSDHTERVRAAMKDLVEEKARDQAHVDLDTLVVEHVIERDVAAAPAILAYAEAQEVDLIVMGTHGRRGLRHLVLGSVAEEVVRHAPCPVMTVCERAERPQEVHGASSVLAPIDFSRHAQEALRYGKTLANLYGARLDLLHVVEELLHPAFYNTGVFSMYDIEPEIEDKAYDHLVGLYRDTLGEPGENVRFEVLSGHASTEIKRYAEEQGTGLIVMATHGLTGLVHLFIGSVAEKVVRTAPCPVFCVKSFGKSLLDEPTIEEVAFN